MGSSVVLRVRQRRHAILRVRGDLPMERGLSHVELSPEIGNGLGKTVTVDDCEQCPRQSPYATCGDGIEGACCIYRVYSMCW